MSLSELSTPHTLMNNHFRITACCTQPPLCNNFCAHSWVFLWVRRETWAHTQTRYTHTTRTCNPHWLEMRCCAAAALANTARLGPLASAAARLGSRIARHGRHETDARHPPTRSVTDYRYQNSVQNYNFGKINKKYMTKNKGFSKSSCWNATHT